MKNGNEFYRKWNQNGAQNGIKIASKIDLKTGMSTRSEQHAKKDSKFMILGWF